jgi:hypothetical protein
LRVFGNGNMSPRNFQSKLEPDADQMLRHMEHLYGGDLDGCHEGKIELAWTNAKDGRLCNAAIFGTDQIEEMVERAVMENRVPGQNVYIGQALRKHDIPPFGRCKDEDFLSLTAFYVDLDDDGAAATACSIYRIRRCPPTAVVVTGRHPYERAQMHWRQETPERDAEVCRQMNKTLADALGGDRSVINPSRVMRLGGSIAWPHKPGRIVECTEFVLFDDDRPKIYYPGQLAKAFPLVNPGGSPSNAGSPIILPVVHSTVSLDIGSEFEGVTVEACLAAIRSGQQWHNNMVRLTGHWISRGFSDEEILTISMSLTLPGYTVDQTRLEVTKMIEGGRSKWNTPNPAHELAEASHGTLPLVPAFIEHLNIAMLPRRRWILGRFLIRGNLTINVAPPGVGKSIMSIEQAVAIVSGVEVTNQVVHEQTKVWIYNNEDDADELKRRLGAILQQWKIPIEDIEARLALNSGADRPLLAARTDRNGNVVRLPDVDACISHIREHGIGVFIVDPFVEVHEVSENSNEQIKAVAVMFREIAQKGNCAVLLIHHTNKPPQGSGDSHAGNMNTARGASALVGVARVVQTLFAMSSADARLTGTSDDERHLYVRLDDAKANLNLATNKAQWFKRTSIVIANSDEVGVLVPVDMEELSPGNSRDVADLHHAIIACLLAQISEVKITLNAAAKKLAWNGDKRFSMYRQTDTRGYKRVNQTLRDAVLAACRSNVTIISDDLSRGFTCNELESPLTLLRFENATSSTDTDLLASGPNDEEEDY